MSIAPLTDNATDTEVVARLNELIESHNRIETLLTDIKTQVGPALDSLMSSPLIKMLGVK